MKSVHCVSKWFRPAVYPDVCTIFISPQYEFIGPQNLLTILLTTEFVIQSEHIRISSPPCNQLVYKPEIMNRKECALIAILWTETMKSEMNTITSSCSFFHFKQNNSTQQLKMHADVIHGFCINSHICWPHCRQGIYYWIGESNLNHTFCLLY